MQVQKQQLELDMEQQTGSKSGKEYIKAVCCHPAYLTFMHAEYIMQNSRLDEAQAGIKIVKMVGRNMNNLRYGDYTTLMAEREKQKSLLMKSERRVKKLA